MLIESPQAGRFRNTSNLNRVTSPKFWAVAAVGLLGACAFSQGDYRRIIGDFRADELRDSIQALSSASRLGGPRDAALQWLLGPRSLGSLSDVRREPFVVTVPDPNATATITVGSRRFQLHPLWPNGVRTSTCDVEAPVIYGGRGTTSELDGKRVSGSIVVMEFESDQGWSNAARLGARAVVFLEPVKATRGEIETKWSEVPIDVPRFWASRV